MILLATGEQVTLTSASPSMQHDQWLLANGARVLQRHLLGPRRVLRESGPQKRPASTAAAGSYYRFCVVTASRSGSVQCYASWPFAASSSCIA